MMSYRLIQRIVVGTAYNAVAVVIIRLLVAALAAWVFGFGIAALSARGTFDVLDKLGPGDWGTWTGGIGAILAFLAAIGIARFETAQRNRQEEAHATLAAAKIVIPLKELRFQAGHIRHCFKISLAGACGPEDFNGWADSMESNRLWTESDVLPLIILPNDVAVRLETTRSRYVQLIGNIRHVAGFDTDLTPTARKDILVTFVKELKVISRNLDIAIQGCESLLRRVEGL